jgi:cytosine/adenosine deaminase-related metal-dependent hydrolase
MRQLKGATVTLVIKDVLLLPVAGGPPDRRADVVVTDGRIAAIMDAGTARVEEARIIDGHDRLLTPGLVNAHTHSPANVLKGTGDRLSHPAFMWRNQADTASRTPDEIRLSALFGCIEHLLGGTTAIIDHFPEQGFGPGDVDAVVDAYRLAGIRALVALRIFDEPYTDIEPPAGLGDMPDNPLTPPPLAESLALVESAIWRHAAAGERIRICPAPSNPMRCSDDLLAAVGDMAVRYNTPVHMHLLETEIQSRIARARYGCSMVRHLDSLGLLNDRLSSAHTIWLDDDDIALFAERGAIPVHNPESNLKLGAGIAPVARMLRAGVTVALGTDGASSNDNLDMHDAMRLALMLQRPGEPDRSRWPGVADVITMATVAGGRALRCAGLGTLTVGAPADLVLHDLNAMGWIPLNDATTQLVFAASGASVHTVIVEGRVIVEDRRIVAFDAKPILEEVRGLVRSTRARNRELGTWAARVEDALP